MRRFRVAYLLALSLIGAMALVWFLRIGRVLEAQSANDAIVSRIAEQHTRTVRFTRSAADYAEARGTENAINKSRSMQRAAERWREGHVLLVERLVGERWLGSEQRRSIDETLKAVTSSGEKLALWSERLGIAPRADLSFDLSPMHETASEYTVGMHRILNGYLDESGRLTVQARREEALLFCGIFLVILFAAVAIFEPTYRRLKDAANRLEREICRAEAASVAKSEFLANMSHEIRTPMNAILGFTESLAESGKDEVQREQELAIIRRNGSHLLSLVNGILDMSKLDSHRIELEVRTVRIREELEDVVGLMRPEASRKGLAFELKMDDDLPETVRTDPTRLKQVLLNLLSNAVKFTEIGRVSLHASQISTDSGDALRCRVTDTGIGMDPEQFNEIFEPFRQADTSITRRFGGTGLGLSITHRLVELFGGELDVISEIGRGTTFTFTVPVEVLEESGAVEIPASERCDRRAMSEASGTLEGASILIVEDNPDNSRLVNAFLSASGADVHIVENGLEALDACAERTYTLVLMDVQMPELDGLEATRRLRARGYTLPIVALTAHAASEDREACLEAGCDEYMTKPISREAIERMCERFCRPIAADRAA